VKCNCQGKCKARAAAAQSRTGRENPVSLVLPSQCSQLTGFLKNSGRSAQQVNMVGTERIELSWVAPLTPQASAYTSSATSPQTCFLKQRAVLLSGEPRLFCRSKALLLRRRSRRGSCNAGRSRGRSGSSWCNSGRSCRRWRGSCRCGRRRCCRVSHNGIAPRRAGQREQQGQQHKNDGRDNGGFFQGFLCAARAKGRLAARATESRRHIAALPGLQQNHQNQKHASQHVNCVQNINQNSYLPNG
jgi:hypothetical protein